jgi:hypothetical protein
VNLFFNAIVSASSLALFIYWFRYGCLLILSAETPRDYREEVAKANRLSFPRVRSMLRRDDVDLDRLQICLEQDYAILAALLEPMPMSGSHTWFEDAMLRIHFHSMRACFHLTHNKFRRFAADALDEMWLVVAHLANQLGERSVKSAAG